MNAPLALSRREIWWRLLLYPGHTLPTAAAPVLVGVGLAIRDGLFAPLVVLLAFVGSWLIHIGGVFYDNYELLRRHPDLPEHPELIHAINDGSLKLAGLRNAIIACFGLAALSGSYLVVVGGLPVLVFAVLGIWASLSYAGGPFAYARYGLAEPIFFIMFGLVGECGSYYIQAAAQLASAPTWEFFPPHLPVEIFLLGLPVGALVTNVLIIDDIRDRHFDTVKGWRTATIRFGIGWSRIRFSALMAAAFIAPLLFWVGMEFSAWILLPLCLLIPAWRILRRVLSHESTRDLLSMTPAASRLALLYAGLLAVGIALSGAQ